MLTFLRKWYASISWYEIHPKHATYCFSILLHSYNTTTKQRVPDTEGLSYLNDQNEIVGISGSFSEDFFSFEGSSAQVT